MKKIFTIILVAISFASAFGQSQTISKKQFVKTDDNADIMAYYPVFSGGKHSEMLNKMVVNLFMDMNMVNKKNIPDTTNIDNILTQSALIAKEIGLKKSIEAFPYNYYSNWHYFENKYVISLCIDQYVSTGLDNMNTAASIINIDPKTGSVINVTKLIQDTDKLMDLVALQFCKDKKLPKDALRIQTGLKYELADLPLAKSIGLSDIGVVFFYNRGEIAIKSVPAIKIELPYSKFKEVAVTDFLENIYTNTDGEKPTMKRVAKLYKDSKKVRKGHRR